MNEWSLNVNIQHKHKDFKYFYLLMPQNEKQTKNTVLSLSHIHHTWYFDEAYKRTA